jgi:hypothetical protein
MRNSETKRLGGLEVDNKIELGRLLDGEITGLRPAQNFVDIVGGVPKQFGMFGPYDMCAPAIRQIWLATHGGPIKWGHSCGLAIRVLSGSPPTPDIRLTFGVAAMAHCTKSLRDNESTFTSPKI